MKRWINILLNLFLALVVLIAFWLFSQVFLLASFRIPSDSMEPELVEGDFVAVWKPTLGARLFDLNATLRLEQTEIHRTPGFRKAKRGDVLVFNFPHPNGWDKIEMHILKYYIKRCIGLPG
ncbi:signal peptidase I, partial [Parabacteroides merdae]